MNRNNEWLDNWRSAKRRPIYRRAYSSRLAYRAFWGFLTTLIIILLVLTGMYRDRLKNQKDKNANAAVPYITAGQDNVLGSKQNLFETNPKTNKPLAGVKAKSYYVAPLSMSVSGNVVSDNRSGDLSQALGIFQTAKASQITQRSFEYNADKVLPIASITKLITAAVASELMDKDEVITITRAALLTEGSQGGFAVGDKLTLSEILHPLLMVSSNDAAEAIALKYGRDDFIRSMNAWVWKIGAYSTNFEDPSGLDERNVSTAHDLATIMRHIQATHPELIDITTVKNYKLRKYNWVNPTNFLNMTSYLGGKNGYTTEAEQTAVAIFSTNPSASTAGSNVQNNKTDKSSANILAIILDSPTRDKDVLTLLRYLE